MELIRTHTALPISEREALKKSINKWMKSKKVFCVNKPLVVERIVTNILTK